MTAHLEAAALIAAWTVLGALWRRWFGMAQHGWLFGHRAARLALLTALTAPAALWLPLWAWPLALAGSILFFNRHQRTDGWWGLLYYGPYGAGWGIAQTWIGNAWNTGLWIDGPMALGELWLGGTFWGSLMALLLWQTGRL